MHDGKGYPFTKGDRTWTKEQEQEEKHVQTAGWAPSISLQQGMVENANKESESRELEN